MKYIKSLFLPAALVIAFVSYVLYGRGTAVQPVTLGDNTSTDVASSSPVDQTSTTPIPVSTPISTPTPVVPKKTPPPVTKNKYKDGTFTGDVVDAYYGNAQVAAVISNGKIVDVQFLQYPSDRQTSTRISQKAMPIFKSEVISAQSAQVNIISGATQISQGFVSSMQTALTKALNS